MRNSSPKTRKSSPEPQDSSPGKRDSLRAIEADVVACRACPRLVAHRESVAREKRRAYRDQAYWGKAVPGFGDRGARLVLVGLAPGAHGSNRTGRMFTGDASGDFLFPALQRAGFASRPDALSRDDGLTLTDCWITAVARCAPPGNRPARDELDRCAPHLVRELRVLHRARIFLALGGIAFAELMRILPGLGIEPATDGRPRFGHGVEVPLSGDRLLLGSYHPSRQNTQTGRLTRRMFDAIFGRSRRILEGA